MQHNQTFPGGGGNSHVNPGGESPSAACSVPVSRQRHSPSWRHNLNDDGAHTNGGGFIVGPTFHAVRLRVWMLLGVQSPVKTCTLLGSHWGRSSQGSGSVPGSKNLLTHIHSGPWESRLNLRAEEERWSQKGVCLSGMAAWKEDRIQKKQRANR